MNFEDYKNKKPYSLDENESSIFRSLAVFLKNPTSKKPDDISHSEWGKTIDERQLQYDELKKKDTDLKNGYNQESIDINKKFWSDVFAYHGIEHLPSNVLDKIKSIAWDKGHSCGYSEVFNETLDLVELVNCVLEQKINIPNT